MWHFNQDYEGILRRWMHRLSDHVFQGHFPDGTEAKIVDQMAGDELFDFADLLGQYVWPSSAEKTQERFRHFVESFRNPLEDSELDEAILEEAAA